MVKEWNISTEEGEKRIMGWIIDIEVITVFLMLSAAGLVCMAVYREGKF